LSREYSYQKILKSDNSSSRYSRKCRGCFLGHSVERSKLISQQRQKEERERHKSKLEKYERQMQSRERRYVIPPSQVRFGVTHSETGDEAADYADAGGSRADC